MRIYRDFSLKNFNTFRVECVAREFVKLEDVKDLYAVDTNKSFYILGHGSNTLFSRDFFSGSVYYVDFKGISFLEENNSVLVEAYSGEDWNKLVWSCVDRNLGGIENLVSIPGSVGGAVVQNIGAYGVELQSVLEFVEYFDIGNKSFNKLYKKDCKFGYRSSIFKGELKDKAIVTKVGIRLSKTKHNYVLTYPGVVEELQRLQVNTDTLMPYDVACAISKIRSRKLPDYSLLGNAGSVFKNPIVSNKRLSDIKKDYPNVVSYYIDDNSSKLSAGWLIESAGLKGFNINDAYVYENHALIIVNKGSAKGSDILNLIKVIKDKVMEKFQIELEEELCIVY